MICGDFVRDRFNGYSFVAGLVVESLPPELACCRALRVGLPGRRAQAPHYGNFFSERVSNLFTSPFLHSSTAGSQHSSLSCAGRYLSI